MKALVLKAYHELLYEEVPAPEPGPGEVLVKVMACGICGSDVHGIDGSTGRRIPPVIMGHEAAGVIAAAGAGVEGWKTGDRITFDSTIYCGRCWHCRRGEINLCDNRRVLGVSCREYRCHGAFAEYVAVPQHILYRLPEAIGFKQAAMVETLAIAAHGVRRAGARIGDAVLVVGAGMVGLLAIQVLRAAGCAPIVAVDVAGERLELARRLGADEAFDPTRVDVQSRLRELTGGRGADAAVEAVGSSEAIRSAVAGVRKGAAVALIGNFSPQVELALPAVVTGEIALNGSCASRGEYAMAIDMIARGTVDVEVLLSAAAPLAEGAQWFRRLYQKEKGLLKVVLVP